LQGEAALRRQAPAHLALRAGPAVPSVPGQPQRPLLHAAPRPARPQRPALALSARCRRPDGRGPLRPRDGHSRTAATREREHGGPLTNRFRFVVNRKWFITNPRQFTNNRFSSSNNSFPFTINSLSFVDNRIAKKSTVRCEFPLGNPHFCRQ